VTRLQDSLNRSKEAHGVTASHFETVAVKELFRGEVAWDGEVEVFNVADHPKAKQCFAWGVRRDDGKGWDVTPQLAVKAAIAAYAR
jgi:hypothetical protein